MAACMAMRPECAEAWLQTEMKQVLARLLAFMIDWVVLFALLVLPQGLLALTLDSWILTFDSPPLHIWAWVVLTVSLPSWMYFTWSDSSRGGATVGKRVMRLVTRDLGGSRLPAGRALLRTAVKLLPWEMTHIMVFFPEPFGDELSATKMILIVNADVLLVVWLAAPFLDRQQHRALHDRVAKSLVLWRAAVR